MGVFGGLREGGGKMYHSLFGLYPDEMATIRARKKIDGSVSYTAQIRIKKQSTVVYQETQTFARKQVAQVNPGQLEHQSAAQRARG
jgi:hypothetical protein